MIAAKIMTVLYMVFAGLSVLKEDTAATNFWCTSAIIAALISMTS